MERSSSRLALLLCSLAVACSVPACSAPPRPDPLAPRAVHERGCWQVAQGSTPLGRVVLLEIDDLSEPIQMYRAENVAGQWLGYVDAQGRVYQRVPFEDREVFRGIYPMDKGFALLYEVDGAVELVPVDQAEAAEASIRFPPREDR